MTEPLRHGAPSSWSLRRCGATIPATFALPSGLAAILTSASSTSAVGLVFLPPVVAFAAIVGAVIGHVLDALAVHVWPANAGVSPRAVAALSLLAALVGAWLGWQ
jgi:hypothetical protein